MFTYHKSFNTYLDSTLDNSKCQKASLSKFIRSQKPAGRDRLPKPGKQNAHVYDGGVVEKYILQENIISTDRHMPQTLYDQCE